MTFASANLKSEKEFASLVDSIVDRNEGAEQLIEFFQENHSVYDQRGTPAVVRMRGWVMLALSKVGLPESALIYVLEELETGVDPYLVAAAARALRSYPERLPRFAPFLITAISNIRYHDEPLDFGSYGAYSDSGSDTSPVLELLKTLAWLGSNAHCVQPEVDALRTLGGLPQKLWGDVDVVLTAIRKFDSECKPNNDCCSLPMMNSLSAIGLDLRRTCKSVRQTEFEDQFGATCSFPDLFEGHPTVVVFFYTRCDNPLKCSLTITKLARLQSILAERGLAQQIHTAAITYDPEFDSAKRLLRFGEARKVQMNAGHRLLRTTKGFRTLQKHFKLGVNFIESLVNRHRIELYILDSRGMVARSFERVHWDEQKVVDHAASVLQERLPAIATVDSNFADRRIISPILNAMASLAIIFFPKCPICWAAYMSAFGIVGLENIPYSPWLFVVLCAVVLFNLGCVWLRSKSTGRMASFYLSITGTLAILVSFVVPHTRLIAFAGVGLIVAGSLYGAINGAAVRWVALKLCRTPPLVESAHAER